MSLLGILLVLSGSVLFITFIGVIIWLIILLAKQLYRYPTWQSFLEAFIFVCIFIFIGCLTYIKLQEKDTTEYQQYLDLKAKYEEG